MNVWRSLAKPVRVAVVVFLVIAALVPAGAAFRAALDALSDRLPDRSYDVLRWVERLWLPAVMLAPMVLAGLFGAHQLWLSWKRPVVSLPEARADAQQLGQWLLLALCGACLGAAPLIADASGSAPSSTLWEIGGLGLGLCASALVAADFLALALTDRMDESGLSRKAISRWLWLLHFAGPLIFPVVAYLVARRAIRRHLAAPDTPAATV